MKISKAEAMKRVAKKRMFLSMIDRDRLTELLNEAYQEGVRDAVKASKIKTRQTLVGGLTNPFRALSSSAQGAAKALAKRILPTSKQNSKQGKSK